MANLDLSKYGITDVKEILHRKFSTTLLMKYCSLKRLKTVLKVMKKVR